MEARDCMQLYGSVCIVSPKDMLKEWFFGGILDVYSFIVHRATLLPHPNMSTVQNLSLIDRLTCILFFRSYSVIGNAGSQPVEESQVLTGEFSSVSWIELFPSVVSV